MNGAKVVARAWVDSDYKQRLLAGGTAAIAELGFGGLPVADFGAADVPRRDGEPVGGRARDTRHARLDDRRAATVTASPLDDESLPRDNGELVFEAPWQARALAIAVALVDTLGLPWDAFRHRLMAEIAENPQRPYYESWGLALESLVVDTRPRDERYSRT